MLECNHNYSQNVHLHTFNCTFKRSVCNCLFTQFYMLATESIVPLLSLKSMTLALNNPPRLIRHSIKKPNQSYQIFRDKTKTNSPSSTVSIFLLYNDLHVIYCHLQHHNDTIIKTQEDFFNKIGTSHFIVRVRKGLCGVLL